VAALVAVAVSATLLVGCDDDSAPADRVASRGTTRDQTVTTPGRPPVDADGITITGPIAGAPQNAARQDLAAVGYLEEEFFVSGTASAYAAVGELGEDGHWDVEPNQTAPYTTRMLVRRPAATAEFSGTVVVEWFNVTGGIEAEAEPDWAFLHQEIVREGHVWVGVSAQQAGVSGPRPEPGNLTEGLGSGGLRAADPERYAPLAHPGDGFSYDIYTQAGRVVRAAGALDVDALGGLVAERVVAVGESQSAVRLTAYVNAVHPLVRVYDGFLLHSRAAGAAPVSVEEQGPIGSAGPVRIRTDLEEPVFTLQTETDVGEGLGFLPARQDDSDGFRLWEVAGTAHADVYLIDVLYGLGDLGTRSGICDGPVNSGQHHVVAKAALHHLVAWIGGGDVPPQAERLVADTGPPITFERDEHGNAVSGVRTPAVDAPIATITGEAQGDGFCALLGETIPFTPAQLAALYPTHDDYVAAVTAAADAGVAAGFILEPDADALVAEARAATIGS
jgi:hypothetical protein